MQQVIVCRERRSRVMADHDEQSGDDDGANGSGGAESATTPTTAAAPLPPLEHDDVEYVDAVARRTTTLRVLRRRGRPRLPATSDAAAVDGPYYASVDVLRALRYSDGGSERKRIERAVDSVLQLAVHTQQRRADTGPGGTRSASSGRRLWYYDGYALTRVLAHTNTRHTAATRHLFDFLLERQLWAPLELTTPTAPNGGLGRVVVPLPARNVSREGMWVGAIEEATAAAGYAPVLQFAFPHTAATASLSNSGGATATAAQQKQRRKYSIDMYFVAQRVAVECDERGHADRDTDAEVARERELRAALRCEFVRFDPDAAGFSIYAVIGRVFAALTRADLAAASPRGRSPLAEPIERAIERAVTPTNTPPPTPTSAATTDANNAAAGDDYSDDARIGAGATESSSSISISSSDSSDFLSD